MSDSSPTVQRNPRRKAPKITTSQDSPLQRPSKKNVPPSPGVPAIDGVLPASQGAASQSKYQSSSASQQGIVPLAVPSGDPAAIVLAVPPNSEPDPKPKKVRKRKVSQKGIVPLAVPSGAHDIHGLAVPPNPTSNPKPKKARKRNPVSRRQQMMQNPFLALQAVECNSNGDSVTGSDNSQDDKLALSSIILLQHIPSHPPSSFPHPPSFFIIILQPPSSSLILHHQSSSSIIFHHILHPPFLILHHPSSFFFILPLPPSSSLILHHPSPKQIKSIN